MTALSAFPLFRTMTASLATRPQPGHQGAARHTRGRRRNHHPATHRRQSSHRAPVTNKVLGRENLPAQHARVATPINRPTMMAKSSPVVSTLASVAKIPSTVARDRHSGPVTHSGSSRGFPKSRPSRPGPSASGGTEVRSGILPHALQACFFCHARTATTGLFCPPLRHDERYAAGQTTPRRTFQSPIFLHGGEMP